MLAQRYFENFENGIESVHSCFGITPEQLRDEEVLIAWYGNGSYCGAATVLFQRDGKLYEVSGSHCSCYGLDGQWSPGETSWEALALRPELASGEYDDADQKAQQCWASLIHTHVPRA